MTTTNEVHAAAMMDSTFAALDASLRSIDARRALLEAYAREADAEQCFQANLARAEAYRGEDDTDAIELAKHWARRKARAITVSSRLLMSRRHMVERLNLQMDRIRRVSEVA